MSFKINNISKTFRDNTILKNFSMELPNSGVICFFGPTGIGKTNLLNIISGLTIPDEGDVDDFLDKKFSFVFQDERLLLSSTVKENIGIVKSENSVTIYEILKKFNLESFSNVMANNLSKGQRQRLSIARALSSEFDILILDEPFQGLDDKSRDYIINLIYEMVKDKLIIFVTHNTYEAVKLSDEIFILNEKPLKIIKKININLPFENRKKYNIEFINYQKQL